VSSSSYVGPFRRIIASIYDFILLIGVWAAVLYPATLINGGSINSILSWTLVLFFAWVFFATFWMKGGQTLGMQVWGFKIVNVDPDHDHITLRQTLLRYSVNLGMLLLLGMPLFLIYVNSKNLAVNDIFSKTKLIKLKN
jgi:uncharacterized RDD family membrane protein YckC|tara:strand:- start:71 stop:487 length:417 start_codon:yes stop_codon:yes gene_type:complete